MKIRSAGLSDLDWLMDECVAFSKTYDSKYSLVGNMEYALKFMKNLVQSHLVLISEVNDVPTGFIAGMVQPHHFNPEIMMLSELLWWVKVEHRGGLSGAALLDAFIAWGKEHCDWITFTIEKTTPISDAPLLKRGFRLTEKAYLMECE
jgi:hypothetical protein